MTAFLLSASTFRTALLPRRIRTSVRSWLRRLFLSPLKIGLYFAQSDLTPCILSLILSFVIDFIVLNSRSVFRSLHHLNQPPGLLRIQYLDPDRRDTGSYRAGPPVVPVQKHVSVLFELDYLYRFLIDGLIFA